MSIPQNSLLIFTMVLIPILAKSAIPLTEIPAVCQISTRDNHRSYQQDPDRYIPYLHSMAPDRKNRFLGIQEQSFDVKWSRRQSSELLGREITYLPSEKADFIDRLNRAYKPHSNQTLIANAIAAYACYGRVNSNCGNAMKAIMDIIQPATYYNSPTNLAFRRVLEEVGTDPTFLKPVTSYALKLFDIAFAFSKKDEPFEYDNIFTGLKNEFLKFGLAEADAEDKTWKILALYSMRGPNMRVLVDMSADFNASVFSSLGMITSIASYLDLITPSTNTTFSMPQQVSTSCNYTRPYHFWMAGYLARELKSRGFNNNDIFHAIHSFEVLYERVGYLKSPTVKKLTSHNDSEIRSHISEIQKDIVFNDAGIVWALNPEISILADEPLAGLFYPPEAPLPNGSILTQVLFAPINFLTGVDVQDYIRWEQIMKSSSSQNYFNKFLD